MALLPAQGNRGTWIAVATGLLVVIVWVLSSAFGWDIPEGLWWVLGISNGSSAVRGGAEHIGQAMRQGGAQAIFRQVMEHLGADIPSGPEEEEDES